ncbi:MAG TPA: MMPL family transporter [Gaiellaceae bacterium]|nr:MMPL family transporter [Gaiellaceae bacterium]
MASSNIAGRAGRWSANNWKKAFLGWLVLALLLVAVGTVAGHKQIADSETASGGAAKAVKMLENAGFKDPATESVLVQSRTRIADDSAFKAAVAHVVARVSRLDEVTNIQNPLLKNRGGGQVSADRHSVLVQFDVVGDADEAKDKIVPVMDQIKEVQVAHPGFRIEEFGMASADHELDRTIGEDFKRAELLTVPATLVILLLAFGALVAAGLPVLLAILAVLASIGGYSLFTHITPGDFTTTQSVVLLIGMAVGVDYSLFYLRREREERHAGRSPREALLRTAATSGQAVLISGATVLVAMAGMFFAGNKIFTSIAIGTMFVVLCAVIGSVTVLAALLSKLGDRVDKGRIPVIGRRKHDATESKAWRFVLDRVLRRPLVWASLSAAALVAATVPVLGMHTKLPSFTDLPKSLAIVSTYERMTHAFPGAPTPAVVVVKAPDVRAPAVERAIGDLKRQALASGQMSKPIQVDVNDDSTVARIDIPVAGSGDDSRSIAALQTLRSKLLPATVGKVGGVDYAVTGVTAGTKDFNDQMKHRIPYVFAFVLALAFLLLLMTFRSLVIPTKAIVLNLLSVGAAYGILVLVFQHTWAEGVLGFTSNGAITSWLPLFLFVVLFGLSMDYHVFILSRVKELHDRGMKTEHAVSYGIRQTAGTVTSAALVMVAVFAIFATLRTIDMKQMGFGLAVAVLLDATIIRAVLLPATMKLLGDWNWYLPRWLEWLPTLSPEGEREPVPEAPPALTPGS